MADTISHLISLSLSFSLSYVQYLKHAYFLSLWTIIFTWNTLPVLFTLLTAVHPADPT